MFQISTAPQTTTLNATVIGQPWRKDFRLGVGVDAITGQLRASAVKPFNVQTTKHKNPEFIYSLVRSESDLQTLISGSASASYNLEGVNVSASTSFLNSIAVSELAVTLVAQVSVQESQYSLAPEYELSVVPDPDFRKKYGDYFVAGYRAGSSLYVVYQCRFTSAEKRSEFAAKLAAEAPQVMSASGSAKFEEVSKECNASVSIHISAQGVTSEIPTPPSTGWTPETIVSVLLPWFNGAMSMEPQETYLEHYRMIDPNISDEVPISPNIFSQLSFLYNRFWLARAMFNTCPDFGRRLVEEEFYRLGSDIEGHQSSLPSDPDQIARLTERTMQVLETLREINNRQVFYNQVCVAAKTEPAKGKLIDADKGTVRWSYGYQRSDMPGIVIETVSDSVAEDWRIGWREHTFHYRGSNKIIVGWDVICNRTSSGGDWRKESDQIIGRSVGDVYVKSDYDRGYSWTVVWYLVNANLYPAGPWLTQAVNAPAFLSAAAAGEAEIADFWTAERMAAALPVDRGIAPVEEVPAHDRQEPGRSARDARFPDRTNPSEEMIKAFADPVTSRVANPDAYPNRTVGKLFFMMGGRPNVASGVVVHRQGIMTAAHCIIHGGQQASHVMFVPAFQDGHEPFGRWFAETWHWPNAWTAQEVPAWDVGFCRMAPAADGRTIGDVVGWVGLDWGSISDNWINQGYPCEPTPNFPFNGKEMWQSHGSRVPVGAASTIAKRDDLTAGGSGGPWFRSDDPRYVNGLFSQYNVAARVNLSPEFADWIGVFFHHVFPDAS